MDPSQTIMLKHKNFPSEGMDTCNAPVMICNHASPPSPRGVRRIAVEMSIALTKVLPWQCGGDTRGYRHKGP